MTTVFPDKLYSFDYTNYRGEKSTRNVRAIKVWYGETDYHRGDQWILRAYDYDKQENRDFAMKDIENFRPYDATKEDLEQDLS